MRFCTNINNDVLDNGRLIKSDEIIDMLNELDPDVNRELAFLEKEVVKMSDDLLEIIKFKATLNEPDIEKIVKIAHRMKYG